MDNKVIRETKEARRESYGIVQYYEASKKLLRHQQYVYVIAASRALAGTSDVFLYLLINLFVSAVYNV